MMIRDLALALNASIKDEQRSSIEHALAAESWQIYQDMMTGDLDEEDFVVSMVLFALSLRDPQDFRRLLDDEQRTMVDQIESLVRAKMEA